MSGNHVSFSNKKNKRKFDVNLTRKRFYIPEEDRWVTLRISTSALKNINLPNSLTSIEYGAFAFCSSLMFVGVCSIDCCSMAVA